METDENIIQLRKLQLTEKEVLEKFVKICDDNNIKYYIIGGTLIGAVRHKGFIPWDDDIDIAVPRNDYMKLIDLLRNNNDEVVGVNYYKDNNELYYYPIRVINKKYKIKEPRTKGEFANPWIDVLPIDGKPNNSIKARIFKFNMMKYRLLLAWHYVDNLREIKRTGLEKVLINFGKITHIGKIINPTRIKDKIDKTLRKNKIEKCNIVGTCMGAYFFHEFVPKSMFGKGTKIEFEGIEVNAPEKIHEYLTHMYGDYMKLPPKEKQVAHKVEFID